MCKKSDHRINSSSPLTSKDAKSLAFKFSIKPKSDQNKMSNLDVRL